MDVVTASQLQGCFTPEDDVWFPDLTKIVWQDLDFFGWVHPSGHLAYIVAQSPNDGALKGVVLRRFERPTSRVRLDMCSLCLHVHGSGGHGDVFHHRGGQSWPSNDFKRGLYGFGV